MTEPEGRRGRSETVRSAASPRQRAAVVLRFLADYSVAETAALWIARRRPSRRSPDAVSQLFDCKMTSRNSGRSAMAHLTPTTS